MKLWRISKDPQGHWYVYRREWWWPFWQCQNPMEYDNYDLNCTGWYVSYASYHDAYQRMKKLQDKLIHYYYE